MCRKMPKAVKKSTKKKPLRQEAVDTGDAGNEIPVTEREDRSEAGVLTGGDAQAGESGTRDSAARDDSVEKSGSDTDSLVERARHRLMGQRRVRLVSITEDEEDGGDREVRKKSSSREVSRPPAKKGRGKKDSREGRERQKKRERS